MNCLVKWHKLVSNSDILHIQYVQFFDDMSQAVKDIVLEMVS